MAQWWSGHVSGPKFPSSNYTNVVRWSQIAIVGSVKKKKKKVEKGRFLWALMIQENQESHVKEAYFPCLPRNYGC